MDGLNATQIISQRWGQVKVLILTVHECEEYFDRAVQVGAKGYFLKTALRLGASDIFMSLFRITIKGNKTLEIDRSRKGHLKPMHSEN
jgi:DNA-binding NarL/FixJ family response regulator